MKGTILHFDKNERKGLITGSDDKRYSFELSQWKSENEPKIGETVDFEVNEGAATDIYSLSKASSSKSWLKLLFSDFKIHNKLGLIACLLSLRWLITTYELNAFVEFSIADSVWGKLASLATITLFLSLLFGMKKKFVSHTFKVVVILSIAASISLYSQLSEIQNAASMITGKEESFRDNIFFSNMILGVVVLSLTALSVWKAKVATKFE